MTNQIIYSLKVHSQWIDVLFDVSLSGAFGKSLEIGSQKMSLHFALLLSSFPIRGEMRFDILN